MMDIVKWLRDERYDVCDRNMRCNGEVMEEAADEIERLREQNAELVKALKSIAYHRKGGPTNNNLAMQLERLAIDAIAKATGGE